LSRANSKKQIVLVLALIAKPEAPTEQGVAWRWAVAYSQLGYDVKLICHSSQKNNFADFVLPEGIQVIFIGPNAEIPTNPQSLPEAVKLWVVCALWANFVRKFVVQSKLNFYLAHHPTISSMRLPSPTFRLSVPSIWGPLGGGHFGNLTKLSWRNFLYEGVRNLSIVLYPKLARLGTSRLSRKTLRVLATNSPTRKALEKIGFRNIYDEVADGIDPGSMNSKKSSLENLESKTIQIIWAGRLVQSKRPALAILVLKELKRLGVRANLSMAGSGDTTELLEIAENEGVSDELAILGVVPWQLLMGNLGSYDICLFTSGRDSSAPLLFESMYSGVKCVAVRTEVIKSIFPELLVPGPEEQKNGDNLLAEEIAKAILEWVDLSPARKRQNLEQSVAFASNQVWLAKAQRVIELRKEFEVGN
jgi:glycosyltransferase involved in cell wall biosynthesis